MCVLFCFALLFVFFALFDMTIAQAIYIRNIELTLFFLPLLRSAK